MQTIAELAHSLGVSKTAVSNKARKLGIKDDLQKIDGAYYFTDEQAEIITRNMKKPFAGKFADKEDSKTEGKDEPPQTITNLLMQQLEKKDEQIQALQEQVKSLQSLLDQQQKLHLITQQRLLALEDKQSKPGLFARLFNRNKDTGAQDPAGDQKGDQGQN